MIRTPLRRAAAALPDFVWGSATTRMSRSLVTRSRTSSPASWAIRVACSRVIGPPMNLPVRVPVKQTLIPLRSAAFLPACSDMLASARARSSSSVLSPSRSQTVSRSLRSISDRKRSTRAVLHSASRYKRLARRASSCSRPHSCAVAKSASASTSLTTRSSSARSTRSKYAARSASCTSMGLSRSTRREMNDGSPRRTTSDSPRSQRFPEGGTGGHGTDGKVAGSHPRLSSEESPRAPSGTAFLCPARRRRCHAAARLKLWSLSSSC